MGNTEHMMGYIEELTSKGFDENLGIPDFSKMLQLIQGYLLEVEAMTEKKQIDDAVNMALAAVHNQCNCFQGHGPEGFLACYKANMKSRGVPEDRMVAAFEEVVSLEFKDLVRGLVEAYPAQWDYFADGFNYGSSRIMDLEMKQLAGKSQITFYKGDGDQMQSLNYDEFWEQIYARSKAKAYAALEVADLVPEDHALGNLIQVNNKLDAKTEIDGSHSRITCMPVISISGSTEDDCTDKAMYTIIDEVQGIVWIRQDVEEKASINPSADLEYKDVLEGLIGLLEGEGSVSLGESMRGDMTACSRPEEPDEIMQVPKGMAHQESMSKGSSEETSHSSFVNVEGYVGCIHLAKAIHDEQHEGLQDDNMVYKNDPELNVILDDALSDFGKCESFTSTAASSLMIGIGQLSGTGKDAQVLCKPDVCDITIDVELDAILDDALMDFVCVGDVETKSENMSHENRADCGVLSSDAMNSVDIDVSLSDTNDNEYDAVSHHVTDMMEWSLARALSDVPFIDDQQEHNENNVRYNDMLQWISIFEDEQVVPYVSEDYVFMETSYLASMKMQFPFDPGRSVKA